MAIINKININDNEYEFDAKKLDGKDSTHYLNYDNLNNTPDMSGFVTGPSSSTDNAIVRFDSTTGKVVQNSNATIADNGDMKITGNFYVPEGKYAYYGTGSLASFRANNKGEFIVGAYEDIYFRGGLKSNDSGSDAAGIRLNKTTVRPEKSNAVDLGDSDFIWKTVYANQLRSTVATGTAPLVVTSKTVVSNLNADLLDGQEGSYYLNYNNFSNKPDLSKYVEKVSGKGLSTNDYTTEDKTNLNTLTSLLTDDEDNVVNKISEVLSVFETYPEGSNIADVLSGKSSSTHTHSVTPTGSVSQPTFTGTSAKSGGPNETLVSVGSGTHTHSYNVVDTVTISTSTGTANYTPSGTVSTPSFTGSQGTTSGPSGTAVGVATSTHTHEYTPAGSVTISTGTGTKNYTPVGTISQPTFTGTQATISLSVKPKGSVTASLSSVPTFSGTTVSTTISSSTMVVKGVKDVGALPDLYGSYDSKTTTLTLEWDAGKVTETEDYNVAPDNHDHGVTAAGTVSAPNITTSFTGTEETLSTKYTPAGTVSVPTFTGTGVQLTGSFTGTKKSTTSISGTTTVATNNHTHTITPSGSISQPTFSGTGIQLLATATTKSETSGQPSAKTSVPTSSHTHNVVATGTVSKPTLKLDTVTSTAPN